MWKNEVAQEPYWFMIAYDDAHPKLISMPVYTHQSNPYSGIKNFSKSFLCAIWLKNLLFYISVLVTSLEGKDVAPDSFSSIVSNQFNEEYISILYCGLYKLLQLALRIPSTVLKQEVAITFITPNSIINYNVITIFLHPSCLDSSANLSVYKSNGSPNNVFNISFQAFKEDLVALK